MRRELMTPRPDWKERLAAIDFHLAVHRDGRPYWREDVCYVLREVEVEMFHEAACAVQSMMDTTLQRLFEHGIGRLGLPKAPKSLLSNPGLRGNPRSMGASISSGTASVSRC